MLLLRARWGYIHSNLLVSVKVGKSDGEVVTSIYTNENAGYHYELVVVWLRGWFIACLLQKLNIFE